MSQNIKYIKEQIKDCEEVNSPYDIKIGQIVKYITQQDGSEYFYPGGKYIRMGDNKIILKTGAVPLTFTDRDGKVIYKTRLFVINDKDEECKNKDEFEKIIHTQQQIIEKLNIQLRKKDKLIEKLQGF
tara:strand:+ start:3751 stop:4134 length:384 start_codon:yes stop_codon:yes gene_type:complete